MSKVILRAPLSGLLVPIEQVPDPVFADKLLGDGVAIDPVSNDLRSPCNGRVIQLHEGNHAVTIEGPDKIQVLMHIGLDTVQLGGEGFLAHVEVGDQVRAGDMLIEFEPDFVATRAPSLLTPVIILNSERVRDFGRMTGMVRGGDDAIMSLEVLEAGRPAEVAAATPPEETETAAEEIIAPPAAAEPVAAAAEAQQAASRAEPEQAATPPEGAPVSGAAADEMEQESALYSDPIRVPNESGLHARPAAVLAHLARDFQADLALQKGEQRANAKSVLAILNLNVGQGDEVRLRAAGADAQDALNLLATAVRSGLGATGGLPASAPASVAQAPIAAPAPRAAAPATDILIGATASPGLAVGNVVQVRRTEQEVPQQSASDPYAERQALDAALATAAQELEALQARLHAEGDPGRAALFAAQEELLRDPALLAPAQEAIANGHSAAFGWQTAVAAQAAQLEQIENELLVLRAADLRDAGRRVLSALTGVSSALPDTPPNTILIAEDLGPSDIAALDRSKVVGFATTLGGATSHTAILARALDLPGVAGIETRALSLRNGTPVVLDATKGKMRLNPRPEQIAYIVGMLRKREQKRKADLAQAQEPAITADGHRMEVVANIGSQAEAEQAMLMGAEGVGLLRTEFLFQERRRPPTEDEQAATYAAIAGVLGSKKPLLVRTLDVGGDKPLPYLPMARENNPFLGERGIRVGLNRPQLLRTQVRAILRASGAGGNIHIMFPMIATLDEWQMAKSLVDEEVANLGVTPVPVGIMVEVPAAAILAEQFAREADFFSIGTNDLTQYVLAMDRGHPKLASRVDGLNPAVLRLIAHTTAGALKHDKWVGVCGGMASDPQAAPLLMGLGVKELSASVPAIPTLKALLRSLSYAEAQERAQEALGLSTAAEVRALYPLEDYEL